MKLELKDFQRFDERLCPRCGVYSTAIKVWTVRIIKDSSDPDEYIPDWRCLNCLGVFTEDLKGEE